MTVVLAATSGGLAVIVVVLGAAWYRAAMQRRLLEARYRHQIADDRDAPRYMRHRCS